MPSSKITIDSVDYEFSFISMNLTGTIPSEFSTKANKPDFTTFVNNVDKLLEKSVNITIAMNNIDGGATATVRSYALLEAFRLNVNSEMTLVIILDGGDLTKTYIGKIMGSHQVGVVTGSPSQNLMSFVFVITGTTW